MRPFLDDSRGTGRQTGPAMPIKDLLREMTCYHVCPPSIDQNKSSAKPITGAGKCTLPLFDHDQVGFANYELREGDEELWPISVSTTGIIKLLSNVRYAPVTLGPFNSPNIFSALHYFLCLKLFSFISLPLL